MASAPCNSNALPLTSNHLMAPRTVPAATSPNFRDLPTELRIMIFKLMQRPRLIQVRFIADGQRNDYRFVVDNPVTLHICRESRLEAQKVYKLAFGSGPDARNQAYFDFESDSLYLSKNSLPRQRDAFLLHESADSLEKLQNIVLGRSVFQSLITGGENGGLPTSMAAFKRLKNLTIVVEHNGLAFDCSGGCVPDKPCFLEPQNVVAVSQQMRMFRRGQFVDGLRRAHKERAEGYEWNMHLLFLEVQAAGLATQWWADGFVMPDITVLLLCEKGIPLQRRYIW